MLDAPKTDEQLDTKTRLLDIKTEEQLEDHKFEVYAWKLSMFPEVHCMSAPFVQSLQHAFAHASDAMNELSRLGVVLKYKTEDMKVRQSEILPAEIQHIVRRIKTTWEIGEVTEGLSDHLSVVAIGADKNVQRARSLKIGMCIAVVVSLTEEERMKITEKKYPALTYVMKHCRLVNVHKPTVVAAPTLGKHKGGSKVKAEATPEPKREPKPEKVRVKKERVVEGAKPKKAAAKSIPAEIHHIGTAKSMPLKVKLKPLVLKLKLRKPKEESLESKEESLEPAAESKKARVH